MGDFASHKAGSAGVDECQYFDPAIVYVPYVSLRRTEPLADTDQQRAIRRIEEVARGTNDKVRLRFVKERDYRAIYGRITLGMNVVEDPSVSLARRPPASD